MKKVLSAVLGLAFVFGVLFGGSKLVERQSADPGGGIGGGDEPGIAAPDTI